MKTDSTGFPVKQGLYDPAYEKDACGVGFVVSIDGISSHQLLQDASTMLGRMEHRGAFSCDNDTGDGAGILTGLPHRFYAQVVSAEYNVELPATGLYATGILFLDENTSKDAEDLFTQLATELGLQILCWRTVPTNGGILGAEARKSEPLMRQILNGLHFVRQDLKLDDGMVSAATNAVHGARLKLINNVNDRQEVFITSDHENEMFRRQVYILRKWATHHITDQGYRFYCSSLSPDTIVYKGLLSPCQLWAYFPDLNEPAYETHVAIIHSRFSTNTFPSWERAHPQRLMAHNGEINTLRGNVNLMHAREGVMHSPTYGDDLKKLFPIVEPKLSDSGIVDNVLEFLTFTGQRTLPEAMITMVPEAWQNDVTMTKDKKAFYKWSSFVMEPWDGPALFTFSDGRYVGAVLDRNGLRPSRFYVTKSNVMYMASEVGVVDVPPEEIVQKGRLKPGRMLLVDTKEKVFKRDDILKSEITNLRPIQKWLEEEVLTMEALYENHNRGHKLAREDSSAHLTDYRGSVMEEDRRLALFGWNIEAVTLLILPMVQNKKEALGSMGNDTPLACLSRHNPRLFEYFKQLFAQVTNPPIDPFREKIVMSLACPIGPEGNILEPGVAQCRRLWLEQPILSRKDMRVIKATKYRGWKTMVLNTVYDVSDDTEGLVPAIDHVCQEAADAVDAGYTLLVLSDKKAGQNFVPISSVVALGAIHHHLIKKKLRMKVGLIVETGEAREVHDLCVLLGYGADAICPYLVFETLSMLRKEGKLMPFMNDHDIYLSYLAATARGISKVMAKMGISTLQSYKGAQIFEAVGLHQSVIDKCFVGTASRIGGVTFDVLALEVLNRHHFAYDQRYGDNRIVLSPGFYQWREGGEKHMNDPLTIANIQDAVRSKNYSSYAKFAESAWESTQNCTLRGQMDLVFADEPLDISEVENVSSIVKRFVTGAMSFGSISYEAHSTLAIAMNRIGAKSNTGEGGESPDRYLSKDPMNNPRSAIKQVASGRFGVTSSYVSHCDELQIKMAQGAKPGEGGELPGYKVTKEIAATRHSIPGVGLISPPPHHDIYSIEDIAQLIYDLKAANPVARISVKLVSEVGVGVIASGIAKAKAEHIVISGHDGGTGASSWTGIKNAGLPWELGISETHQTLVLNNLRSRVVLQADGQIRTGRDVIVAALLGADEVGFSTAPLIAMGCTMMRKCHLNTCPVGIATQDPILRKKFQGTPENVVNFMFMLAEDIRSHMARLGFRTFQEMVGRTDKLTFRPTTNSEKAKYLDLQNILTHAWKLRSGINIVGGSVAQNFFHEIRLDNVAIEKAKDVIDGKSSRVEMMLHVRNIDRTFGATLSYMISMKFGEEGLPDNSINIQMKGTGGQSFCAFLARGIYVELEGDANDYVGKALSGGEVVIYPPKDMSADFKTEDNIIVGNVVLYGATSGKAFFRGQTAERFCVRNSGAIAVCEGCGDHGCEYMTGGRAVVLGLTGRNFAAGMSGGIAYVLDREKLFDQRCNHESVDVLPVDSADDMNWLRDTLYEFVNKTGSALAQRLLDDWPASAKLFVKIFPYEYQRVLAEAEAEAEESHEAELTNLYDEDTIVSEVELQTPIDQKHFDMLDDDDVIIGAVNTENIEPPVSDIEDLVSDDEEEPLDKARGFVKYRRATNQYRPVAARLQDWGEVYNHKGIMKGITKQAARCMDCGVPFCQSENGCPLGNLIPKWNDLVFQNHWKEALQTLLQTNNFPEFTGRCCPAPCEGSCVLAIGDPAVTIKNIENAIIDAAWTNGWMEPDPPTDRTGKMIAIVGSGPSGLAAAAQLNKVGHTVTVYERNDCLGGLLRYGIPTMKLGKDVVQRRVDFMKAEGINFETNMKIGEDVSAKDLLDKNDALLLCMGSAWARDLPIPGRKLDGIHYAMNFLEKWQRKHAGLAKSTDTFINANDKEVIIIGGGDTGVDCIATSLRQGARNVTTFEILPAPPKDRAANNPWPLWPKIMRSDYGHEEAKLKLGKDPRIFSIMSKEFVGDAEGHVCGIRTVLVNWTKDDTGRWVMNEVPDSEKLYSCDIVVLAMGFLGPEKAVIESLSLNQDPRSNIETRNGSYATSVRRVYAAGDCRRGQSLVVHAINEGRQAARQIDLDLMGCTSLAAAGGVVQPIREMAKPNGVV